jgi:hypothetical protein
LYRGENMGLDSYTKLLLHCDGADGSTTFIDSATGKTVTAVGNAQIDTAQSKFGGASALFDGAGDYLSVPNHADFDFGSGNFTIDFWVRLNAAGGSYVMKRASGATYGPFQIMADSTKLYFTSSATGADWGVLVSWTFGGDFTTGVWYHIAGVRYGNLWSLYVNGVSKASATVSQTVVSNTVAVSIGANADASAPLNGWMDEVRISKGIARWTANFTPPNRAYGVTAGGFGYGNPWMFMKDMWEKHDKLWTQKKLILPKEGFSY